ncbi:hypothetical protein INT48_004516 [Thamnidium elegans]|uniref:F-box domain-containing protein n=1 Tax=Thamnidium elegans TaxID=101142 RepID=A0A8H7T0H9_9FUNG|nr:hypothetical protein INT48_004516 [Thamnidium elegans]
MSCWGDIPVEILGIIFKYLELKAIRQHTSINGAAYQSQRMLQCQLVCKNWDTLAQINIYKQVTLKSTQQLEKFTYTLVHSNKGSLVKYIKFRFTDKKEILNPLFRRVARFCTDLRMLELEHDDEFIWDTIKKEREKGHFLKLEVIPFINDQATRNMVRRYNLAAYSLRHSLRELIVYELEYPLRLENKIVVPHFLKVEFIHFQFGDCSDLYTIDFRVKECPSIKSIDVICKGSLLRENSLADIRKHTVYVLSHIKRLRLGIAPFGDNMYTYIMQTFPNLESIFLDFKPDPYSILHLITKPAATDIAIQFLRFLIQTPLYSIRYFPLKSIDDVLIGFDDDKNIIKNLHIAYVQGDPIEALPYISLSTYSKVVKTIKLQVCYVRNTPYFLPRLGLVERSGTNLQHIKIDMGVKYRFEETMLKKLSNVTSFSDILSQCPNLREIEICNTPLYSFTSKAQYANKLLSCDYIYLFEALIYPSFLAMLSSHVSYIAKFTVASCTFIGNSDNNIDMPDTTFDHIVINGFSWVRSVYLKLERTGSNSSVTCYTGSGNCYQRCAVSMYEEQFFRNKQNASLFIRCKDVRTVSLNDILYDFKIIV